MTQVSTHGNRETMTPSYTRQRPPFELNCVECHDVHGTSNIYMINTVNTNGPLVAPRCYNNAADTTSYLYNGTVAFTDHSAGTSGTSGIGFANTSAGGDASKICQTCHSATIHYEFNSNDSHFTSVCTSCHPHEFDASNATQDAFMPKGNCEDCHDGSQVANGAPDVTTNWTTTGHAKSSIYDPDGVGPEPARSVECTDCHDLGEPASPASAGHAGDGSGTYNSIWYPNATTRSTNTSHLKAEFFTKYPAVGAGDWSVQVAMDNYCTWECHDPNKNDIKDTGEPAKYMRHEVDTIPTANDHFSVKFGTHLTPPLAPNNIPDDFVDIPIDVDLNTAASPIGNYAPCVSCHDPHGTNTTVPAGYNSNLMMRYKFPPDLSELCAKCHR